ncbi:segregation and condensation protein A [Clostridium tepidiprofundi DSM 19306]|uniref:Segregation and condensation protein A n=1 Tax=Clostridium tepidiprofundi DSM 19306 TaxID=1121338 RepID=A0A151B7D1_9CLOT|nr:segregation/condensation protein A [Clostridium tepidiprofundi]KYH35713.1 segregation and condensation protein A [Clostridium tepidiprofundi DSM 19306]
MALSVKTQNFEGPFDLLLHLIKKDKMNIYDIRICEITNQYLELLREMKELDLDIASEFIVMASILLELKSKELLPKSEKTNKDESDGEDTKQRLIEKLIEYKKIKNAAEFLKERLDKKGVMFAKKPEIIEDKNEAEVGEILKNVTLIQLYNLYNDIIFLFHSKINVENNIQKEIPLDLYKIDDKINELTDYINKNKRGEFSSIVRKCSCKIEIIVTFLALLEMIKLRTISIVQENNFKEIYFERTQENE